MGFKILEELHERSLIGIADKLPWRLPIEDGVVMTSNGGFMASYEYVGPNPDAVSAKEVLGIANQVNESIMRAGAGWTWNYRIRKRRAGEYTAENPDAPACVQLFDAERREFVKRAGIHYRTQLIISIIYHRPNDVADVANRYFFEPKKQADPEPIDELLKEFQVASEVREAFNTGRVEFERDFAGRLRLHRLGLRATLLANGEPAIYDDHASYLYATMRGTWQPMVPAPVGMTIAKLFAAHEAVLDWEPRVDDDAIVVVNVTQPPKTSRLGHMRILDDLAMEFDVNLRCVCFGRPGSRKHAERKGDEWESNATGFFSMMVSKATGAVAKLNRRALELREDANKLVHRIDKEEVTLVQPTFSLIFYGKDRKEAVDNAGTAVRAIRDAGYVCAIARVDAARSYFATLPGEVWSRVGRYSWTSANVALTVPLTSVWTGVEKHPSRFYRDTDPAGHIIATTTGGALCKLPLHWNTAGHTLIFGAQRSGKSVLLKRLALQHLLMKGGRLFALDRDESMYTLATLLADEGVGAYYNLENDDLSFCPAEFIGEPGVAGEREQQYFLAFVEQLLELQNVERSPERREALVAGIARMAASGLRRLSELSQYVSDEAVWKVIDRYTNPKTLVGRLLDGDANGVADRRAVIIETAVLSDLSVDDATPVYRQLLHLMDRMSRAKAPMQAMFDECSVYLRDQFLANYLFEVLRRWGKRNVHGIFATQGVIDIDAAGELGEALAQECKTKIFCGDTAAADEKLMARLHGIARLSSTECEAIARNAEHRGYYYTSPLGRATFWLGIQNVEATLITRDEGDDLKETKELRAQHPTDWFPRLLEKRDLTPWANYYRRLLRANSPITSQQEAA